MALNVERKDGADFVFLKVKRQHKIINLVKDRARIVPRGLRSVNKKASSRRQLIPDLNRKFESWYCLPAIDFIYVWMTGKMPTWNIRFQDRKCSSFFA